MPIIRISGHDCNVVDIADGFARGEDGTCAFCNGDPCNEFPTADSNPAIIKFYKDYPDAPTCPCCDGKPT
jgi:hypothetical protein